MADGGDEQREDEGVRGGRDETAARPRQTVRWQAR
jgi:hypothetical protein